MPVSSLSVAPGPRALYDALSPEIYDEVIRAQAFNFTPVVMGPGRPSSFRKEDKKETDRLDNCGTVLKEILDIPDDIPPDLLDKAECVIIFPSVLKAAFIIGGSYGRGP